MSLISYVSLQTLRSFSTLIKKFINNMLIHSTLMFIYTTWNVQIIKQGKLIYRSEKYRK